MIKPEHAIAQLEADARNNWPGWRPVTAAALLTLDEHDRVWMTTEEFIRWREQMGISGSRHTLVKILDLLNMGRLRLNTIMDGGKISRVESLACAHALFGLQAPVQPGDSEAFASWIAARFGATGPVAAYLRYPSTGIGDRIKGFKVTGAKRSPRAPEIDLIRALDWVDVMGPWSPYGDKPRGKVWAGQEVF